MLDLDRDDSELELAAADVEHMAAALLLPDLGLAGLDLQTLAKCLFLWHLLQVASLAGGRDVTLSTTSSCKSAV